MIEFDVGNDRPFWLVAQKFWYFIEKGCVVLVAFYNEVITLSDSMNRPLEFHERS